MGGAARDERLDRLETFVGRWRLTMRNAWFLEPPGREVPGSAGGEWLDDAFVVFRWSLDEDVAPATRDNVMVFGLAGESYAALYHDERGVGRLFDMTIDDAGWRLVREDADMHQRFVGELGPDRITGRWEASDDQGATWRTDLELELVRA